MPLTARPGPFSLSHALTRRIVLIALSPFLALLVVIAPLLCIGITIVLPVNTALLARIRLLPARLAMFASILLRLRLVTLARTALLERMWNLLVLPDIIALILPVKPLVPPPVLTAPLALLQKVPALLDITVRTHRLNRLVLPANIALLDQLRLALAWKVITALTV